MGESETAVVGSVLVGIVVQLAIALALFAWGRWVARRHGTTGWRRAAWTPIFAFGLQVIGIVLSTVLLIRAFGAIGNVDASRKATILAENISEAMNATALFLIPSYLLYLASVVAFLIGSVMRARA